MRLAHEYLIATWDALHDGECFASVGGGDHWFTTTTRGFIRRTTGS